MGYQLIKEPAARPIWAWTRNVELEAQAEKQLRNIAALPFIHHHVAVMPDVHWGLGATIGSVIPTTGAVIPAAVGVDIGCGMIAARTNLRAGDLPESLRPLRLAIEEAVPHGRTHRGGRGDKGAWQHLPARHAAVWEKQFAGTLRHIYAKHPGARAMNTANHLGTLGTGNHFVEVCLDENQNVWAMLHSGSRGVGNKLGTYFIELAKGDMKKHIKNLPDRDLAYFREGSKHFDDYIESVEWAQGFALANRRLMMENILNVLKRIFPHFSVTKEAVNCHHNYVARERHYGKDILLTRKGALRARRGELGIIPGSMGAKSFIVRGKGNAESFESCSHGAGRQLSRRQALRKISIADHIAATEGIECRKDKDVIDESPAAYKSIENVMKAQEDLVDIVHTLRQVVCVKG